MPEAQIAALQLDLATAEQEARNLIAQDELALRKLEQDRSEMARSRSANTGPPEAGVKSAKARGGRQ